MMKYLSNTALSSLVGISALAALPAFAATPADVINLSRWTLQLPTGSQGSPDTISAARLTGGYQSQYFKYDSSDNSVAFFTPDNGVTTPNSRYPRTELREMQSNGTSQANWDPFDSKTHTLKATIRVTDARHRLCIGQTKVGKVLRNGRPESTKPLFELYYEPSGDLKIGLNRSPFDGQDVTTIGNIPVNTKFTYQFTISGGSIKVFINGSQKYSRAVPSGFRDYGMYFKAGNYNQTPTNTSSNGTRDKFYALTVSHQ